MSKLSLRPAQPADISLILDFIQELAEYERLSHQVVADPLQMTEHLFGPRPFAEVLIGEVDGEAAGFACSSTTTPPSSAVPGCTWKTSTCVPPPAAPASARRCWPSWHAWR